MTKTKSKTTSPKRWRATVNLDRMEADTGMWRITTGSARDPLPRAVATDPNVRASVAAWMTAHRAKQKPEAEASEQLAATIRVNVTTAFRALPPETEAAAAAVPVRR